ncbi:MAG: hypothetical protein ACE5G5_00575 [Candidatus Methylomirabilales bacterium]
MVLEKSGVFLLALAMVLVSGPFVSESNPEKQIFTLRIHHRKVTGDQSVIRVTRGDMVTLRWTTDEAVTIHLHGYDLEQAVKPGSVTEFTFEAYATGRFPITAHGFGEHPHRKEQKESVLLYLEVLPR